MIQQMIKNMLGDYANYVTIENDGVTVKIPTDINNPSMDNAKEVKLTQNEAMSLMSIVMQPKQYQVGDRTISEGDTDFDMNKWIELAINSIKK